MTLAKRDAIFQKLHPETRQRMRLEEGRIIRDMVLDRELYEGKTYKGYYPNLNGASPRMRAGQCAVGKESVDRTSKVRILSFRDPGTKWTGLVREIICPQHYRGETGVEL